MKDLFGDEIVVEVEEAPKKVSLSPFDIAKNINAKTGHIPNVDEIGYSAFMMNRVFSNTKDTALFSNELNRYWKSIDAQMHYDFLYFALDKNPRRFGKWNKASKKDVDIQTIQDYYHYSFNKAREVYHLFNEEQLEAIREALFEGGRSSKKGVKK